MPRTRSLAWSELKIGIVAVVAHGARGHAHLRRRRAGRVLLAALRAEDHVRQRAGLKRAPVRVAGVEVGKVTDIEFVGAEVQVDIEVNKEQQSRITDQSRASIGSLSLLGEPTIEISPASSGTPLKDGDFIPSARTAGKSAMSRKTPRRHSSRRPRSSKRSDRAAGRWANCFQTMSSIVR